MTLDELARTLGVTRQQVGRLEAGKRTLRPDTLERLAEALGVPLAQLEDEGDLAAWVADMLRLLGYVADVRQPVRDEYGISFAADVVATLTTGPIEVRAVVTCRQAAAVEDVQALQGFVDRSNHHLGILVTVAPPGPDTLDYAARRGTLIVRRDDLLARLVDLGAYARSLDERWRTREVRFVEPRVERAAGGPVQTLQELVDSWLAEPAITHLVLLGEPGSGKTTACQHLAALLARRLWPSFRPFGLHDDHRLPLLAGGDALPRIADAPQGCACPAGTAAPAAGLPLGGPPDLRAPRPIGAPGRLVAPRKLTVPSRPHSRRLAEPWVMAGPPLPGGVTLVRAATGGCSPDRRAFGAGTAGPRRRARYQLRTPPKSLLRPAAAAGTQKT